MYDEILVKEVYLMVIRSIDSKASAWGAHAWKMVDPNTLQFNVQGKLFKGLVRVRYDEKADVFHIYYGKIYKGLWWSRKTQRNIHFKNIACRIHQYIEDKELV